MNAVVAAKRATERDDEAREALIRDIEALPDHVQQAVVGAVETLGASWADTMDIELALDELNDALEPWPELRERTLEWLRPGIESRLR